MTLKKFMKPFFIFFVSSLSLLGHSESYAQTPPPECKDALSCLQVIYQTATGIFYKLETLPEYIRAWLVTDDTDETAKLQQKLVDYIDSTLNYQKQQKDLQVSNFLRDYFATYTPPFANQVSFTTLLGSPYSKDQEKDANGEPVDSAYNYVKNASGLNISHIAPSTNWRGSERNIQKYVNYYKTISAVQSFNTYVMTGLYTDKINNYKLSGIQDQLLTQASSPSWFESVATENIGIVLRQMLLFNSQTYVVLLKLLETQKQQLAAQSITNTLLIVGNQFTETDLLNKATGNAGPDV